MYKTESRFGVEKKMDKQTNFVPYILKQIKVPNDNEWMWSDAKYTVDEQKKQTNNNNERKYIYIIHVYL